MKIAHLLFIILLTLPAYGQEVHIIPQPLKITYGEGVFEMTPKTKIITRKNNMENARYLQKFLEPVFNEKLEITKNDRQGIVLKIEKDDFDKLGEEGYFLKITTKGIYITGATKTGVFYGIQSLKQMFPVNLNSSKHRLSLPVLSIQDKPRFPWRDFMLDEARYFKGMKHVKNLLDQMALLKMNTFHWHLTDDQGWRIEIKKYPKLTQVGSYREDSQIGGWNSDKRSGKPHKGFYTQAEIKEIIAYAAERHIRIIPEIEMPGHASAAIAAYPWLGTIGELEEVPVVFGKLEDSFNVVDPKVYTFLKDVLLEVMELFPSKIIHIGGDEVKFGAWKNSEEVQRFMKEKGLGTPADLQIYFTNKISNFIESYGHRMIGWNEIMGGEIHGWQKSEDVQTDEILAKNTIVQFWKGNVDLINKAVSNGYDVVNSYHIYTYLDYSYDYTPIEKAYSFEPIPEGLEKKYHDQILGLGCQMWGEWIPQPEDMYALVFPRIAAFAEIGWTAKENKDYKRFRSSLNFLLDRWEKAGIGYAEKFEKKDFIKN